MPGTISSIPGFLKPFFLAISQDSSKIPLMLRQLFSFILLTAPPTFAAKPNVLFIAVDDLASSLGSNSPPHERYY
ncbi:MAG: hypothetical protein QNL33_05440 [Akkermansiaceae bacterium]